MDASYDGSFGSFSAGGKNPGEGIFGETKNGANGGAGNSVVSEGAGAPANNVATNNTAPNNTVPNNTVPNNVAANYAANNAAANNMASNNTIPNNVAANNMAANNAMGYPAGAMMNNGAMSGGMVNGMNRGMPSGMGNNGVLVSVGAGGINLSNAEEKKPKKGLIIGIIVAVVLVIVGVLVAMTTLGGKKGDGGGGQSVQPGTLKEKFNSYINYVWYGEDSDADIDRNSIFGTDPYFLKVQKTREGVDEYLAKADEKLNIFADDYYKTDYEELLGGMKAYFQDYVGVPELTVEQIAKMYLASGQVVVEDYIERFYSSDNESMNRNIIEFVDLKKKEAGVRLEMVIQIDKQGCISNGEMIARCYNMSEDISEKFFSITEDISTVSEKIINDGTRIFSSVYSEVYGEAENGEDS